MGICRDCRFWEQHHDMYNRKWHECSVVNWVDKDAKVGENEMALYADATDDTGLTVGLKTGAMFGCFLFQQDEEG